MLFVGQRQVKPPQNEEKGSKLEDENFKRGVWQKVSSARANSFDGVGRRVAVRGDVCRSAVCRREKIRKTCGKKSVPDGPATKS
jgi:hypothetical protein